MHLLFTCTANQIRSPFAAAVARRCIDELGLAVAAESAGQLLGDEPADDRMVAAARRHGIDLSSHRSVQVSSDLVAASDLIVTMTGRHVVELAEQFPESARRTITLREWAHATQEGQGIDVWTPGSVMEWGDRVSRRPLGELLSGRADVADPVGRWRRAHRRTAQQIQLLVTTCFGRAPDVPDGDEVVAPA